jgi:hypothetical protein
LVDGQRGHRESLSILHIAEKAVMQVRLQGLVRLVPYLPLNPLERGRYGVGHVAFVATRRISLAPA